MPLPRALFLYGLLLGTGVTTFVPAAAAWALLVLCVALGSPAAAIVVGLGFALGRALPVLVLAAGDAETALAERPEGLRILRVIAAGALVAALLAGAARAATPVAAPAGGLAPRRHGDRRGERHARACARTLDPGRREVGGLRDVAGLSARASRRPGGDPGARARRSGDGSRAHAFPRTRASGPAVAHAGRRALPPRPRRTELAPVVRPRIGQEVRVERCAQELRLGSLSGAGAGRVLYGLPPLAGEDLGHERGHTTQGEHLPCPRPPKPTSRMLWTTALTPAEAYVTVLRPSGGGHTTPSLLAIAR